MSEPRKKGFFSRIFGTGDAQPAEGARPPAEAERDERQPAEAADSEAEAGPARGHESRPETGPETQPETVPAARSQTSAGTVEAAAAARVLPESGEPVTAEPCPVADEAAAAGTGGPGAAGETAASGAVTGETAAREPKTSWFSRLKSGLTKTSSKLSSGITGLFTKRKLDAATLDDFEDLLIQADLGVETAMRITGALSSGRFDKGISPDEIRQVLADEVERVLAPVARPLLVDGARKPHVILMVGVNGTGKTTTIGKLAQRYAREGRKVMMAAGDTFRAAAIDQLKVWGARSGTRVVSREVGADAAGLAFDALKEAKAGRYDVLLIDTAGRLQNKAALMDELEKVVRVLRKLDETAPHDVLLVLDATTGQNALQQVEVFRKRAGVTGLVMTKLDGTARGGIVVAIADKYKLPVHAIGVGEGIDDMQPFEARAFARAIADLQ